MSQGGYASNFGTGVGGGGIRGVEGQIMSHVFKPVVTRFVESNKEIKSSDSLVGNIIFLILPSIRRLFHLIAFILHVCSIMAKDFYM